MGKWFNISMAVIGLSLALFSAYVIQQHDVYMGLQVLAIMIFIVGWDYLNR